MKRFDTATIIAALIRRKLADGVVTEESIHQLVCDIGAEVDAMFDSILADPSNTQLLEAAAIHLIERYEKNKT